MRVRAARLKQHGAPLEIDEVELPEPGGDEVLVELEFAGVNPIDGYTAQGQVAPDAPLPRTLGAEASGTLDGQPVLVAGEHLGFARDGVWAQAAVVPRQAVHELPAGVESREAAAMGIAGLTAWNIVHDLGAITAEDRVLVLGASGGVGSIAVSLAHATGATVWGQTGSADKAGTIEEQGADRVLVGGAEALERELAEFQPTVALDPLAGPFLSPVIESLVVGGRVVSYGASAGTEAAYNVRRMYRNRLSILGYGGTNLTREERRDGLARALSALAEGSLRVRIADVLRLEDVNEALARFGQRQISGNLLLELS